MLCDWHNHNYINPESMTVTYKHDFCMQLVDNHLDTLYDKYAILVHTLLVLDEWVYLVANQRLFTNGSDRAVFRRYALILEKCKEDQTIENCAAFCREFNINRYSYMFDGEIEPLEEFTKNFSTFF